MNSAPDVPSNDGRSPTPRARHPILHYGIAVLAVVGAVAITHPLVGVIDTTPLFYAAIIVSSWYGGKGPGLLAVFAGALAVDYYFIPPVNEFSHDLRSLPYLGVFALLALVVNFLSAARQRAERSLRQARDEMEAKVIARTADLKQTNEQLEAEVIERKVAQQLARGQVEVLMHSADVLATAPAPDKFIGQMLSTIAGQLEAQAVALWMRSETEGGLVLRLLIEGEHQLTHDPDHSFHENAGLSAVAPIQQEMLFTAAPVVCDDIETDERVGPALREYFRKRGIRKFLAVPVLAAGEVRGLISVRHGARQPYRREEIELAQALAHQVMLAIQLTELGEQGRQTAVLEERTRMARDIHDTLAQGFTGVIVQLEAADDARSSGDAEEATNHVRRARELARQSLGEARRSVRALRPLALEETNFWDALKSMIKNATIGTALHTDFQLHGQPRELLPNAAENLLHIGQEALTNALKHARATRFATRLFFEANDVRLELEDDGDGFIIADGNGGFGLTGMKERAEQIGGTLTVISARGQGTKIVAVSPDQLPLP